MKSTRQLTFISLIITVLLSINLVTAQDGSNFLTNGGFEGAFTTLSGDQPRQVAENWTPWHIPATEDMPSFQNASPKYQPVAPDASRVRTGSNSQLYFSFFETHQGGIYQQVSNVTNGEEYRFSIYAHIWSSTFDDVDISEDPGDVALRVGIDPTGGTDGTSVNIIWSTPAIFYDTYRQYSVIATAASSTITVFVESTIGTPVQNSYIYLDDAVLESTSQTTAPTVAPTATPIESGIGISTPTSEVINNPATNTPVIVTVPPTATQNIIVLPTSTPTLDAPISDEFPSNISHIVSSGDTVSRIAAAYDSTIEAIITANDLNASALIFVGQTLIVPVRTAATTATTTPTVAVAVVVTATQPATVTDNTNGTYVVQPGDTLNRIATRFNTTIGALVQVNGIANANRILSGQVLNIPGTGGTATVTTQPTATLPSSIIPTPTVVTQPAQTYTVQAGDTLFRLALNFGVNIGALAEANNITNYNRIDIGQVLQIP